MKYWLDLFTPYTWTRFREHGASVSGFRPRQRRAAFERVERGDILLCYLVRLSRWCGILEVSSQAFEDSSPIFSDENDPFPIRFTVNPQVLLEFEEAIPIEEEFLWKHLSFTRDIASGSFGWAQFAGLRTSLREIETTDGELIARSIRLQSTQHKKYPLSTSDLRHMSPTIIRTEQGDVETEIPERDTPTQIPLIPEEARSSAQMQAKVAQIGATMGFNVWIPPGDRNRISEILPALFHDQMIKQLPLNYDNATLKTIENIDVIWLHRRSIVHAFEVEHTTLIYSGLLRMADLLAMQPRINIGLHVVAPDERREQVRREIIRPVFSTLEGGAMADKCSFLSYTAINELVAKPDLPYLRESILELYEEFFEV